MLDDRKILNEICSFFNLQLDENLVDEYLNGFLPNILNYEKLDNTSVPLTAFQKYLIGYAAHIKVNEGVPFQFYDIFRSCRHTLSLQLLQTRLSEIKKIKGHEERIEKLIRAIKYDDFESVLFELIAASKYAQVYGSDKIEFLEETDTKQPDFAVNAFKRFYVECKRMNRTSNNSINIRNRIRELHLNFSKTHIKSGKSALLSIELIKNPLEIEASEWNSAFNEAMLSQNKSVLQLSCGTITKENLSPIAYDNAAELFPSVAFYKNRYDYVEGNPWGGITHSGEFNFAYLSERHYKAKAASTLISSIRNEIALKWKLSDELNDKIYRKLNFNQLFKGLEQLKGKERTVLHFCFERDPAAGHRQETLFKLLNQMIENKRDSFGWIIFNELLFMVSIKGRFDMQEHAHPMSGPLQFSYKPPASCVFTEDQTGDFDDSSSFGVGHDLEDIDSVYDKPTSPNNRNQGPTSLKQDDDES